MKKIILLLFAIVFSASAYSQDLSKASSNGIDKPVFYENIGNTNTKAACQQTNLTNSFENGRGCSAASGWTAANDLIVADGENFSLEQISAEIWLEVGAAITSVDVTYYTDNVGLPGTQIGSQLGVVPTSQVSIGSNFGWNIAEVILDITPFVFNGQVGSATTYWIAISTYSNATGDTRNFWGTSTASAIGSPLAFNGGGGFSIPDVNADGVYTFSGDCNPIDNPPVISCPADVVADSDPGVCGAVVNFADASAIDPEDGPLPTVQTAGTPLSGEEFPVGVTTVEFSATDSAGQTVTCQFTVTVNDIEDPVAVCQDLTVELDASGMASITPADIDGGSSDNCTGFTVDFGGASTTPNTLLITYVGGNGHAGNMFDVNALNDIVVNSFDINMDTGTTDDVEVYYKTGTWVGSETTPGDWTLLDTATGITSAGVGNPTPLNLNLGLSLTAGSTVAFYVTLVNTTNINYTNGTTVGNVWAADTNLEVLEGAGKAYPFSSTFQPRNFNGTVHYDTVIAGTFGTFDCSMVGENLVPLLITDASGNTDECLATVTVEDNQAPIVICVGSGGAVTESEGFEGATIPAGWTTVIESGSWDWTFGSGYMPGTDDFPTNAAIFDDDAAGPDVNHARLISPVVDLSTAAAASVAFDYALGDFAGSGILIVEMWDGAAWQEIFVADGADIPPTNTGVLDVFAYANAAAQLRFSYDDENGGWNWGAGVDNLEIMYEMPPTPPLEVVLDPTGHATVDLNDLLYSVDDNCGYTVALGTGGGGGACEQDNPSNAFENGTSCTGSLGRIVANDLVVDPSLDFTIDQITANIFNLPGISVVGVDVRYYEDNAGTPGTEIGSELGVAPTSQAVLGDNFGYDISAVVLDVTPFTFASAATPTTYWVGLSVFNADDSNCFWEITTATGNGNDTNYDDGSGVWQVLNPGDDGVYVFSGTCGSASRATVDFDCSDLGENMVDIVVTDDGGNEATCTATVIVLDETAPVITCGPEPTLIGTESVSPGLTIDTNGSDVIISSTITVADDYTILDMNVPVDITHTWIGDIVMSLTSPAGTTVMLHNGTGGSTQDIVLTYDDEGDAPASPLSAFDGESTMGVWTLDIEDTWPGLDGGMLNSWGLEYEYANPNADLFIELGADGTVTIEPMDVISSLDEACEVDVMLVDITDFTCDDIGAPILVTVFVNDTSGNPTSCQVEVNIVDNMEPTLTCPGNTTAPFDPATGLYVLPDYFDIGDAFATDNCTDVGMLVLTQDPLPGTSMPATTGTPHMITFTAEDEYGNIATCVMELDVAVIGIEENELLASALAMYPNPATNQVTLVNSSAIALETAMIYDLNGKLVAQIDLQNMQNETTFDVSNFASGVFMVKIIGENASTVKRLIKK